ncbi:hypothetical protein ACMD2_14498 [Ananas comosus]|uniref:Uncharacterized protein n=1 Tax=Ananas comosus TaxID=4615 RepID=A0A199UDP9_ANACO|nr:hypothetical protein ACMD2_14498 [Ananas comosus]
MTSFSSPTALLLVTIILLFHIGLSSSASSSSLLVSQSQKMKLSSKKNLLSPTNKEDNKPVSASKLLKKKPILESKNQTKLLKPKKKNNSTTTTTISSTNISKIKLPKLNKTLTAKPKPSNSTKLPKLIKPIKPAKSNSTKLTKTQLKKQLNSTSDDAKPLKKVKIIPSPSPPRPKQPTEAKPKPKPKPPPKEEHPAWLDETDGEDLISEFRGLPARLQEALVPDLERLSSTSRAYLSAANAGIAEGVRPYLGHKWAPRIALAASAAFLAAPLLLLGVLLRHLGSCLPLVRRLLVFAQAYLAIYFATLAATALATGLEPLRLFYATSPGAYAWAQAAQSLGYVAYLVLQLVDLVAAFPPPPPPPTPHFPGADGAGGRASPAPALAQMVVGLAVGLHYYAAVFHRAVAGEPPRATWRVHAVYAACFLVICAFARAERRKKEYVCIDGGEDGKKS